MTAEIRSRLAIGGLVAIVAGCGGAGSQAVGDCDQGCSTLTAGQVTFIQNLCNVTEPCCVANGVRAQPDLTDCQTTFTNTGVTADSDLQTACLSELQQLSSSPSCFPEIWNLDDPCLRAIYEPSGPEQPGQGCHLNADCAGSAGTVAVCDPDPSDPTRTHAICVRLTPGAAGDAPCLGDVSADGAIVAAPAWMSGQASPISTGYLCEQRKGLHCSGTTRACEAALADGSPCSYLDVCASGSCLTAQLASVTEESAAGTCAATVSVGAACLNLAVACDATSYCDVYGDGTCHTKLGTDATCTADGDCVSDQCFSPPATSTTLPTDSCSAETSAEALAVAGFCLDL